MSETKKTMTAAALSLTILIPALSVGAHASAEGADAEARTSHPSQRLVKARKALSQGLHKMGAEQYSEAIRIFEYAVRKDPQWGEAQYQLGNAYYHRAFQGGTTAADKGDAQSAVDAYRTALAIDPKARTIRDPFLLYHGLSQCLDALGQHEEALAAVRRSIRLAPRNPMPNLYGAKIRFEIRDYEKSAANLMLSVRRARRNQTYPQLAKLVRTSPLFMDILSVPQNKAILDSYDAVEQGTLTEEEAKERIEGAEDFHDALTPITAVRRPPSVTAPVENPVVTKFVGTGHRAYNAQRFREAAKAYQAALTADTGNTLDAMTKALIYERIGSSYRQLGLAGEAIRVLEKSAAEDPKNSSAYYELSLCYAMGGQLGTSLTFLNKALDTASTKPQLRKTVMLSKTDSELAPLRDMDRYQEIIASHTSALR